MIELINIILLDLKRYEKNINFINFIKNFIFNDSFKFTLWFRITNKYPNFFTKIVYKHYLYKYNVDIPYKTSIGHGLYIGHIIGGGLL